RLRQAIDLDRAAAQRAPLLSEAADDLKAAIELQPEAYQAHVNLSRVEQERGDPAAALTALDRARKLQPDNAALLYARARLDLERGDHAGARDDFAAYADAEKDVHSERLASARTELAHLQQEAGAFDDALKECDAALRDRPDYAPAHLQRADVLRARKDY